MRFSRAGFLSVLVATTALLAAENGYNLFQQGLAKERAEADLRGAIQVYEQVVQDNAADRKLAAQALFRIGECQRALGDAEAPKAYERIIRDYLDQQDVVAKAQTRLAALRPPTDSEGALSMRQVWSGEGVNLDGNPSPDGRYFASASYETGNLQIRDLRTGESRELKLRGATINTSPSAGGSRPVFSQDGKQLAYQFWGPRPELRVIDADGTHERTLLAGKTAPYPVAWSPDSKWIAAVRGNSDDGRQIVLISTADGAVKQLKSTGWRFPSIGGFSADGRFLVYSVPDSEPSMSNGGIFALAADGTQETRLVDSAGDNKHPVWTPDGTAVVFQSDRAGSNGLWALTVNNGKPSGAPELLRANIGEIQNKGFDRHGRLHYGAWNRLVNSYVVDVDPKTLAVKSDQRRLTDTFVGSNWGASWSPDGKHIAYYRAPDASRNRSVVIRSVATGEERELPDRVRLGNWAKGYLAPQWFPDGKSVMVLDTSDGRWSLKRFPVDGGNQEVIFRGTRGVRRPQLSPDGKAIYYSHVERGRAGVVGVLRLMKLDIETGEKKELYRTDGDAVSLFGLALSPDGTRLSFMRNTAKGHGRKLFVISSQGGEPAEVYTWTKPRPGWLIGAWTPDSQNILVSILRRLWVVPADGGEPKALNLTGREIQDPVFSPDGRQIAFTAGGSKGELWVVENLLPQMRSAR